jgi:hypothetical protein
LAYEDLWKAYERYARNVADSLTKSNVAASELSERYGEVIGRIKTASEELDADLLDVHEQFQAELAAVAKSPLVDRCKRAYQAMVESYMQELATVASTQGRGQTELSRATHRAADAYSRAVDDLNAEVARQVAAAYGRYLSGLSRASSDADIARVVAAGNEELVHTLSRAYRATRMERPTTQRRDSAEQEEDARPAEAGVTSADLAPEEIWSEATSSGWDEAETPTWEDVVGSGTETGSNGDDQEHTLTWDAPRPKTAVPTGDMAENADDSPWGLAPAAAWDEDAISVEADDEFPEPAASDTRSPAGDEERRAGDDDASIDDQRD